MAARKPNPTQPRRPRPSRPPKLRVLKVLVQPVLVIDHGTHLEQLPPEVHEITASEWPTYATDRFPRELHAFEQQLHQREGAS